MAFGFFRRHQKGVIFMMAILMVSFLIGFQGFQQIFHKDPGEIVIAKTHDGEIDNAQRWSAEAQLRLVGQVYAQAGVLDMKYALLNANGSVSDLAYVLLQQEARKAGTTVTEADVDTFLAQLGLAGAPYNSLVSQLKQRDITEKSLRGAIAGWLSVIQYFDSATVDSPPSEPELRSVFRDLTEKIDLTVAKLSAEDFLDDAPEPTEQEVFQQFQQFREAVPGRFAGPASFGFGYRQPARVKVLYLLVRRDVIERVIRPSDDDALNYFLNNRDDVAELMRGDDAQGADETGKTVEFADAREKILEKLRSDAAQAKMDDLVGLVDAGLNRFVADGVVTDENAYQWAWGQMVRPADSAIERLVNVKIDNKPLAEAIAALAKAAGVSAICYPWGQIGQVEISPDVRVSLKGEPVPLRQALADITRQVLKPEQAGDADAEMITWATCEGFGNALFASGGSAGLELLPVVARETEPMDAQEVSRDEVLGSSYTSLTGGQPLLYFAFSAESLAKGTNRPVLMKVGDDGRPMFVRGDAPGRLLWQLAGATRPYIPESPTPEIIAQVVKDVRLAKAFALARKRAEDIELEALKVGVATAATNNDLETYVTEPFSRNGLLWVSQYEPPVLAWQVVPGLEAQDQALREYIINKAFSVAPKNVEPPYPQDPPAVALVAVPALRQVAVIQRVGFVPAVASQFDDATEGQIGRAEITRFLTGARNYQAMREFFTFGSIARRMGFRPVANR